jgi:hypothetical protein
VRYAGDPWEPRRYLGSWLDFAANAIETDPAEVGPRIEPPEVASPTERKPAHEAPGWEWVEGLERPRAIALELAGVTDGEE